MISDRALLGAFTREEHRVSARVRARRRRARCTAGRFRRRGCKWATVRRRSRPRLALVGVRRVVAAASRGVADAASACATGSQRHAEPRPTPSLVGAGAPSGRGRCRRDRRRPPPSALDQLLVQTRQRHDHRSRARQAVRAVGRDVRRRRAASGCDQASQQGLECLFQKGSWAQLRTLNRPAILTLTDDLGRTHQVAADRAHRRYGDASISAAQPRDVPIAAISRYWFGDFLLLWRPPLAQAKALGPGMRGADVRWLRESLRSAQGLPPASGAQRLLRRRAHAARAGLPAPASAQRSTASPACRHRSCSTRC